MSQLLPRYLLLVLCGLVQASYIVSDVASFLVTKDSVTTSGHDEHGGHHNSKVRPTDHDEYHGEALPESVKYHDENVQEVGRASIIGQTEALQYHRRGSATFAVEHQKNEDSIRRLFTDVCHDHDLRLKLLHGANHWKRAEKRLAHRTVKIAYRIKDAGRNSSGLPKGLGLFAAQQVKKNQPVYGDWMRNEVSRRMVVIPYSLLESTKTVAAEFSHDMVDQLFEWCEDNWLTYAKGLLCEMDDQHYVNHSPDPNVEVCPVAARFNGMCANRDIHAGEELTEDYGKELLDNDRSDEFINKVMKVAGSHAGAGTGCPKIAKPLMRKPADAKAK